MVETEGEMSMRHKTIWQWIALISFILGAISNLLGYLINSWWFIPAPFVLFGFTISCIILKPVNGSNK